jgi:hydroxylaminobenzene mutase
MNPIPQQLLISGTVLFLFSLLIGFAVPVLRNPRMGVSVHVAGVESGIVLWVLGLMWPRLALPAGMQLATQLLAVLGLYAIFASLLLAALWGTSRATPIAGAGHQASRPREATVTVLLGSGSIAILIAAALVLWGLCAWKATHT